MAEIRGGGTWDSAFTADEFTAIRSVGCEPVGQVLGAAVYNIGYTGGYNCPGPFGDGMVSPFPAGCQEFRAIGTAVRAPGARQLQRPFTCDLSGQDFTKLISTGWVPVGLAFGISVGVRHDDRLTRGQTWWSAGNAGVFGYTELVNDVRRDARNRLHRDIQRLGAEGVVIADMSLRIRKRSCPVRETQRDHVAEATMTGTAIARFSRAAGQGPSSLSILSLNPQRQQAARMGDPMTRGEASRAVPFVPSSPGVPRPLRPAAFIVLKNRSHKSGQGRAQRDPQP